MKKILLTTLSILLIAIICKVAFADANNPDKLMQIAAKQSIQASKSIAQCSPISVGNIQITTLNGGNCQYKIITARDEQKNVTASKDCSAPLSVMQSYAKQNIELANKFLKGENAQYNGTLTSGLEGYCK